MWTCTERSPYIMQAAGGKYAGAVQSMRNFLWASRQEGLRPPAPLGVIKKPHLFSPMSLQASARRSPGNFLFITTNSPSSSQVNYLTNEFTGKTIEGSAWCAVPWNEDSRYIRHDDVTLRHKKVPICMSSTQHQGPGLPHDHVHPRRLHRPTEPCHDTLSKVSRAIRTVLLSSSPFPRKPKGGIVCTSECRMGSINVVSVSLSILLIPSRIGLAMKNSSEMKRCAANCGFVSGGGAGGGSGNPGKECNAEMNLNKGRQTAIRMLSKCTKYRKDSSIGQQDIIWVKAVYSQNWAHAG